MCSWLRLGTFIGFFWPVARRPREVIESNDVLQYVSKEIDGDVRKIGLVIWLNHWQGSKDLMLISKLFAL